MRFLFLLIGILFFSQVSSGQKTWKKLNITPEPVVCYGSGIIEKCSVPPPENLLNKLKSAKVHEKTCDIIVKYVDFPDSVKNAFEYAVSLWEYLIDSDIPIYITAKWEVMKKNTLASSGPAGYYRDLENFPFSNRYYPVAIAEKLAGKEITGSDSPDITCTFNKSIEWYYGTDLNTPTNKYDFVSTVLHELAHGLGFTGFFDTSENIGGYDDPPAIFDQYIADVDKHYLIDKSYFKNFSSGIYKSLTSNALYLISPNVLFDNGSKSARLYAPAIWSYGSSVYHLNDGNYPAGTENSLMTHAAGYGEAIHYPGPITMAIMADLGWKNLIIKHDEHKDVEPGSTPVFIETSITSDYKLDSTSLYVYFSHDSFVSKDSVLLKAEEQATNFKVELPVAISSGVISYYISATDEKGRVFTKPLNAPQNTFKLRIGPDTIKPTISHQPQGFVFSKSQSLNLTSFVDDNIGIDSVWVEYFTNKQNIFTQDFNTNSVSVYSSSINLLPLNLKGNDTVSYRIVAKDISSNHNISTLPSTNYFSLKVEESLAPVTFYSNTFNEKSNDFISVDFEVKTENGFIDGSLNSPHPYQSPEQNDMFFNFMATLKYPIILLENGQMDFDEIVLVEPGETGTVFGDDEFWDYVIVEGSKDFGVTWLPLADGYDSRDNLNWQVEYDNGIKSSGNSTIVGTKEMFIRKNINFLTNGNFAVGDTVFIRFRLFSDPYANGWGWVIDNLRIQSIVSAKDIKDVSPGDFRIYPNPFSEKVTVGLNTKNSYDDISISVVNCFGSLILNEPVANLQNGFKAELNLKSYSPGMYYIQVFADGKRILSRKLLKQ